MHVESYNWPWLDAGGAGSRVLVGGRNFRVRKELAPGVRRFLAADVTADKRDARSGLRQVKGVAGRGRRNISTGPAEKTNDNATAFVSQLLGHATLPTRIGSSKGDAIIQLPPGPV